MHELTLFVHSTSPDDCASPNVLTSEGFEDFPGFYGTGFFARRADEVFYITARHCLTTDPKINVASIAASLHVPYSLSGKTETSEDCVAFDEIISVAHNSDEIPGRFLDFVVLTVRRPSVQKLYEKLLERAVRLPVTGQWLDSFITHPLVQEGMGGRSGIVCTVVGYPKEGSVSAIDYPDGSPVEIVSQSVKASGRLSSASSFDRCRLDDISWKGDYNGFSGSPVIVAVPNAGSVNYALAGMVVTAGAQKMHFIRVGLIVDALKVLAKNM